MRALGNVTNGLLVKLALNAPTRSKRKERLMQLWENGNITVCQIESLIREHGLKHD